MPLWSIYHPPSTFTTPESKQRLAADITSIYTGTDGAGLPAFYVVVNFISLPATDIFVGGQNPSADKPFIRFVADHIAVHLENNEERMQRLMGLVDAALRPHVKEKGYDWELHIDETPRGLWVINGIAPPPWKSAAERRWAELNRAVEWEGKEDANL